MKLHFGFLFPLAVVAAVTGLAPAPAGAQQAQLMAPQIARAAAAQNGLAAFYESRGDMPFWSVAGGPQSPAPLLAALEAAPSHALPAAAYGADRLRAAVAAAGGVGTADPSATVELEVALSRALARYAADLSAGVVKPNAVDADIHVFPVRPEPFQVLTAAASAPDLGAWLASLAPRSAEYDRLRALYADVAAQALSGGWRARLGEGGTLRQGDDGPRVAQLRERLAELGDATAPAAEPERFDAALEATVMAFQRRHGLNADGVVGPRTFAALGADADQRMRQVAVNLERLRWGAEDDAPRRLRVNIADFRMQLFEQGRDVHASRVVVGQRRHRTPEFSDVMDHIVVNPTWHVPRSIATQEILPALRQDPEYLAKQNMRLVSRDGPTPEDPALHDWTQYTASSFPYRVRQAPGASNALGRVKFMFPNRFNIYLHDTPSKSLFRRDARAFSHGCVRVEDPYELAYILLAPQEADPRAAFARWLDTGREIYVNLDAPIPVTITYRTAWVDESGEAQFRADVYGRDEAVWRALESAGLAPSL